MRLYQSGPVGLVEARNALSRPVLTIAETAAVFGASIKMIRRAIRAGELETVKIGRTTFVLREPLERRLQTDLSCVDTTRDRVRAKRVATETEEKTM
jgi:hypothetical protein